MSKVYDVIIAGGGPIGLFLACELGQAHTSVLVLERDLKPDNPWKVNPLGRRGLNTVAVEALYRRGLLNNFLDPAKWPSFFQKRAGFQFGGHFAGILLDANKLDLDRWKYRIPGPALLPCPTTVDRLQAVLIERAESLGVTILRDKSVAKIAAQDDHSVTVEVQDGQSFRGRWLVGCDGGRSLIRKAAGFDFVGTEPKFTGYTAQCDFDHPERLKPGFNPTKNGMYILAPNSLYLVDFDDGAFDRSTDITKEHLQEVLDRVTGKADVKITNLSLASSLTDRSKQATQYRKGRILLAGDAAHIHSPLGAQGVNLGLGDAMNLGWKLAATIRQESKSNGGQPDLSLLDTYESERHPVGAWILEWNRAQVSVLQPNAWGTAIQTLVREMIDTTDGANLFIGHAWGLSQRYKLGDGEAHAHPLVGSSAPDFELLDGTRLGSKLEGARGLLVDFKDNIALKELLVDGGFETRVDYVSMAAKDQCGLGTLLIRPDGVVAWVAENDEEPSVKAAKAALEKWFGF